MNLSTIEALIAHGGGLPPSGASITITDRQGGRVVVSTWETCLGVSAFVSAFLGEPSARAKTLTAGEAPCSTG